MPMPSHCEPWPGKTNTVYPVSTVRRPAPTPPPRRSNAARPASDQPMSAAGNSSRTPINPASRAACDSSAAVDLADTTHGTTAGAVAGLAPAAGSTGGPASMITGALDPLMPNDDPPARRARPFADSPFHGCGSVSSCTEPVDQSTCGLGASTCSVAGSTSWRIARIIFITPATPAAAWVWPIFDLIDPNHSGDGRS